MKKLFFYIFVTIMIMAAPEVFAQTPSNADFNPFPQMEQDVSNTDDQAAAASQQQNDDTWPPPDTQSQSNSAGDHE